MQAHSSMVLRMRRELGHNRADEKLFQNVL